MKIQIDTDLKIIKLENSVKLEELIEKLILLFPSGEWKEYKLETNTVINWTSTPIIFRDYPKYEYYWFSNPQIYCTTSGTSATYNIEC